MMKVFLSADMEGTCGIVSWNETERSMPGDYTPMQKQMTREVAAACRGALAAGAEEVLVKDAHDTARNIDPTGLPRGIRLSPDGKYLLSGNMVSGDITTFTVNEDGTLTPTGKVFEAVSPSAIKIFEA